MNRYMHKLQVFLQSPSLQVPCLLVSTFLAKLSCQMGMRKSRVPECCNGIACAWREAIACLAVHGDLVSR